MRVDLRVPSPNVCPGSRVTGSAPPPTGRLRPLPLPPQSPPNHACQCPFVHRHAYQLDHGLGAGPEYGPRGGAWGCCVHRLPAVTTRPRSPCDMQWRARAALALPLLVLASTPRTHSETHTNTRSTSPPPAAANPSARPGPNQEQGGRHAQAPPMPVSLHTLEQHAVAPAA